VRVKEMKRKGDELPKEKKSKEGKKEFSKDYSNEPNL
jgi:hypothetical protein